MFENLWKFFFGVYSEKLEKENKENKFYKFTWFRGEKKIFLRFTSCKIEEN